ncbi:MAG TPA: YceI family protein [Cytophagales bacterium]|nr:YceI family protein [Cytophagales bacterium]
MKKVNSILAIVALVIFAAAFTTKPASSTFKVVPGQSSVNWLAKKVTGQHNGTVSVKGGEIHVEGNSLKGGNIVIDMTSIVVEDLKDAEYNKKLVTHLKSDDFFGVEKYPTSNFEVTSAKPIANAAAGQPNYELTGKLTIKKTTNEVTVPATVTVEKKNVNVKASFKIDRSKYDVRYGSTSFFDNLGDKAIYDDFELNVDVVAKK